MAPRPPGWPRRLFFRRHARPAHRKPMVKHDDTDDRYDKAAASERPPQPAGIPGSSKPALLVDVKEVAAVLGVSARTVWRLVSTGEFPPPIKLGRLSRWRRKDVLRYVEEL